MMMATRDEQFDDLVTRVATDPAVSRPAWVGDQEWDTVMRLARIECELREGAAMAPPLHEDKTAIMLGLVPDPAMRLDQKALKTARMQARLSVKDVAHRLSAFGWDISTSDVFGWEARGSADVPPAVIESLADIIGCSSDVLTTSSPGRPEGLRPDDPRVRRLVERLAAVLGSDFRTAFGSLDRVAVGAVHRGEHPRDEELLNRLEHYVSALEGRHGG